jgi:hypothetical protein
MPTGIVSHNGVRYLTLPNSFGEQVAETARPRATVEARILAHPAVASVSDERAHGDGYWVILREGAEDASNPGCGTIHEASPSACLRELQRNGVRWTR